ncbi:transposase [Streptomyces anulatus]
MCSDQGALIKTKAVSVSLLSQEVPGEAFAEASRFRDQLYACLTGRGDELFELADAVLCAPGAVHSAVELTLLPEHRRGHGAMYDGLNEGRIDTDRLRSLLAGLPLPRFPDGRLVLAVDVSPWLRSDAPCSPDRLFCHVYGRAKTASQFIPGWPYSFVAVLETGATSWSQILDAVRLGPADDATAVTAAQLRGVVERLIAAGQWVPGEPDIIIVADAGYDITRLAWVLRDLPVELIGRVRGDRVMRLPKPTPEEYAALGSDDRCRLLHGDFFAMVREGHGLDPQAPGRLFHAILLDVDHSPRHVLHPSHAALYQPEGLSALSRHLHPGGVFALWSNDPPDDDFVSLLTDAFQHATGHVVDFPNPLRDGTSTNTIYVSMASSAGSTPELQI